MANNTSVGQVGTIPANGTITSTGTAYIGASSLYSSMISANTISSSTFSVPPQQSIIVFNSSSREIVRLNPDGTVTWADGYNVDEAAENFSRMLKVGAEMSVGITERVKRDMRDSVFEDLIEIAKSKGALSAEDLTYLLNASKIVEKLKGGK